MNDDRMGRSLTVLLVLLAGALRLLLACRPLEFLDRLFVPDDAYYTLAVARSLAHGLGPTVDGDTLTSGVQPLLAFLQVPFFWFSAHHDVPLRATLVLVGVCDTVNVALLARIARRLGGPVAGVAAAAFWAFSPLAIANAMAGLETSVALTTCLCFVGCWWWAAARPDGHGRLVAFVVAGALAGASLLARIDLALLVAAVGIVELLRGGWRTCLVAASGGILVVAPWWLYCWIHFGSPIPESGAAVSQLLALNHGSMPTTMIIGRAAGMLLLAPFASLPALRDFLAWHPALAVIALTAILAGLAGGGILLRRSSAALVLTVHALGTTVFYMAVLPALWFFRRYLAPAEMVMTLLLAVLAGKLWGLWFGHRLRRILLAAGACSLTLVAGNTSFRWLAAKPAKTVDVGWEGAKGYRDVAMDTFSILPASAVVGAFQSGALSYYRPDRVRVVNLDGVVDAAARRAGRRHLLADYARQRGVEYLADWPFNISNFVSMSSATPTFALDFVGTTRSQGREQCTIYKLKWAADDR